MSMRKDVCERINFMKKEGMKINMAEIARVFGCDPRTVKKYCQDKPDVSVKDTIKKPSLIDPFKELINEKVDAKCTAVSIFKFLQKRGYKGKYTILSQYCKAHKEEEQKKATIRFETNPGLQAQVDWKEEKTFINRAGKKIKVNIFLVVLGYSRMKYLELTLDRNQDTLFKVMINAFKYFEGIPKEIIFDNMKTVIDHSRTQYHQAVINKKFYEFSRDMGFEVWACRPYRPRTKGKVEALAKLTNRLDPYNREFDSISELYDIVLEVCDDLNNEVSKATNCIPRSLWKNEREYLLPLPHKDILDTYFCIPITRKVSKESMIVYNNIKYSLPVKYIGKTVEIKVKDNKIYIFYNNIEITSFEISNKKFNYKEKDMIEILKSDVFKDSSYQEIEAFAKKQLEKYDSLGG